MRELFEEAASQPPPDPRDSARASARTPLRKRFYKETGVTEAEGGFAITLDGKPIRTPSGRQVVIPSRSLADAVAGEWAAQGEAIDPVTMPHSTRKRIARALAMLKDKKVEAPAKKHDNLPL